MPDIDPKTDTKVDSIKITEEMMFKALKGLNADKSPGPDELHPRVLKLSWQRS